MIRKSLLALVLVGTTVARSVDAQTSLNLNTGTAAWQVTQTTGTANGPAVNTIGPVSVLVGTLPFAANLPGFEAFAWTNPFGGAVWVGQLSTDGQFSNGGSITCGSPCGATAGFYVYTLEFDGSMGGMLNIGGFTGDNGVRSLTVTQTGGLDLYACTSAGPGTLCASTQTSVTATTGELNFDPLAGRFIRITATVENIDGPGRNPSGFILAGNARLNSPTTVPEPSTYAMMGIGLAAVMFMRRRMRV
ncbi:MAG: PEP-CTERM sorting domain-containing protein [Gemmatimonadaceae bacterium]|nr:PEP-CTERM sorting domain-containing protein [Gemmatimonadaceae bacterium]